MVLCLELATSVCPRCRIPPTSSPPQL
uniref:Uncharacterized protein n=1 Tax=Arundo donax TaxID=35708 RepID=A0A0A9AVL9_ARUDO